MDPSASPGVNTYGPSPRMGERRGHDINLLGRAVTSAKAFRDTCWNLKVSDL